MDYERYKTIPNALRDRRTAIGLSQHQVARVLGLRDHTLISRWEQGEALPSLVNALRLSAMYHTSIEELFPALLSALQETPGAVHRQPP